MSGAEGEKCKFVYNVLMAINFPHNIPFSNEQTLYI